MSYRRGIHNGHTGRVIHIARHICIHKRQTQGQTHRGLQRGRHTEATTYADTERQPQRDRHCCILREATTDAYREAVTEAATYADREAGREADREQRDRQP